MENTVKSDISTEKCICLIKKLISTDTAQPFGNEAALCDFIAKRYEGFDVRVVRFRHDDLRASVVVEIAGGNMSGIAFFGHLDTVATGDLSAWTVNPFAAEISGDTVYGRGAADMKGGIASMLMALDKLLAEGIRPDRRVLFCFTADEEKGGTGASAIAESGILDGIEEMIFCEPSGGKLGLCEKGAVWLELSAVGKSCHASRPELGENAAEKLMDAVLRIKKLDAGGETLLLPAGTISLTAFNSGVMTNILPDTATAKMDIRTTPPRNNRDVIKEIEEIARETGIAVEIINDRPAVETDNEEPFVQRIRETAKHFGRNPGEKGISFYTDASIVVSRYPFPFVIFGPGDDAECHTIDEKSSISEMVSYAKMYFRYIDEYCKRKDVEYGFE
ncbi:MAG: M20 family metallopeptidase [Ruminococcaceae bacterium]|nr:M20 family metallopeptidase [Oscillospiraceae bacterium]